MGPFARLLLRKADANASPVFELLISNGFGSSFIFRSLATRSSSGSLADMKTLHSEKAETSSQLSEQQQRRRTVAVFWDLDNKPPKRVPPFEAATRLKEMAGEFGEVVDVVAYANHHAFTHVPNWIQEERRQRKVLDLQETTGEVKPEQPYVCGVCGAKKKTHVQLTKHFKMLHEREQKKRTNRLDSLKTKKRQKERYLDNNSAKMLKYNDAARSIIIPAEGYGLMRDIRRAGVYVRTVKDTPQAADIALKDHMRRSIRKGVKCICLVSDDTDFKSELQMAKERRLYTVVVGDLRILDSYADTYFSWAEVASGRAEQKAKLVNGNLLAGKMEDLLLSESIMTSAGRQNKVSRINLENCALEEDIESESGSGSDEDKDVGNVRWRPVETPVETEYQEAFHYFDGSTSESDSEESKVGPDVQGPSNLHGCLRNSKFGIISKVPTGLRRFTSKSEVVHKQQSINDLFSKVDNGPPVRESTAQKPERLHYFFTMLESFKGNSSTKVSCPMIGGGEEVNSLHFKRVQDILRSSESEKESNRNDKNDKEGISESHPHKFEMVDAFGPNVIDKQEDNLYSNVEPKVLSSFRHEDTAGVTGEQKKRSRIRSASRKSRVIKVVSVGPRPFYMSGFASKSQRDCDAVNEYYAEFWKDEGDVYKGNQHRRRKK